MTYYTKHTPPNKKKHLKCQFFLFLFSNDFGSLNVGDPAKRSSLILSFPLLEQKRDEGPKTYHQGKYDQHARKQNMVMGGHDDIL